MKGSSRAFIQAALIVAALAGLCQREAYSQNTSDQEMRKARLEKEISILDDQLKANSAHSSTALSDLTLIHKKVASRRKLVEESDSLISSCSRAISEKEKELKETQSSLDTLSSYYDKLVRSAYKNRSSKVWFMYILASDDFGQALRRYSYLRNLSKQMTVQARKIKETQAELEKENANLEVLKKEAEAVRRQRVSDMEKLTAEENQSKALVVDLKKEKKKYQQQLSGKRREVEALNREIERIIRREMEGTAASKDGNGSSATKAKPRKPIDYKLAKQFEGNKGKLPWPVEGPVVDHFGEHYHPVYTKVKLPFNNGISIAVPPGTTVRAVFEGEVKQIVVMPGYNKCVLVQHGSYFTFYCKLFSVNVKAGDKVTTSQAIGTVDTISGETQLHFQIWSGKTPQNPELWLRP